MFFKNITKCCPGEQALIAWQHHFGGINYR